jgi:hypothetical protein
VSSSYASDANKPSFATVTAAFADDADLLFADLLSEEDLQRLAEKHHAHFGYKPNATYTVALTLWAFLAQCLSASKTCTAAVARVIVLVTASGGDAPSANNGAYCKARGKLPVEMLHELTTDVGQRLSSQAPPPWLWKGRHVKIVDGTTLSGPDSEANQKKYPQPRSQKKGLGFPLMRVVVLICLATATVADARFAPWSGKETGEAALFRELFAAMFPGEIALGDRYHGSFAAMATLKKQQVDSCFRMHQRRQSQAKNGKRLGKGDFLVVWSRPRFKDRPSWMTAEEYASLPETMEIREVHFKVAIPGFRVDNVIVTTTLLDSEKYSANDIEELYRSRWHVELDLRYIKTTLKMDILQGQTPEMMEREIWGHFLVYNLVRRVMMQAAAQKGCSPLQLSFSGALAQVREGYTVRSLAAGERKAALAQALVKAVGQNKVSNRPNRSEPRARKRRPKDGKLLTKPRAAARAALRQKTEQQTEPQAEESAKTPPKQTE